MLVVANSQKRKIIEGGRTFLNSLVMRLYKVNVALSGTVMPVHATDEVTDGGYAGQANPFPNVAVTAGTVGRCVGIVKTWTFTHSAGDQSVYGVYFTDPADGNAVVMAEARATPFAIVANGQIFIVSALFDFDTLD